MLKNVLITLAGVEGDAFYFDSSVYPKSKITVTAADRCHPGEVEALQRVTACGALVNDIRNYEYPAGLYADAVRFCINDIINEYYDVIIQCERDIVLQDEFYSLTYLETVFSLLTKRLEFLHYFLFNIIQKNHGVAILNSIVNCVVGDPVVREVSQQLNTVLSAVFLKQLQSWLIQGKSFDPHGDFIISTDSIGKKQTMGDIPSFMSENIVSMISEIGNLVRSLKSVKNAMDDWESFVDESLSTLPKMFYLDSHKLDFVIKDIYKTLSKKIAIVLRDKGLLRSLNVLRKSFLGGRGDLTISLYDSLKFKFLEEVTETASILEELASGAFKLVVQEENTDSNLPMMLWYDIPKNLGLFYTTKVIERYSKINKFLVKLKFSQSQVTNLFHLKSLNTGEILIKRKIGEFINSFYSFIQLDVISVKYSQFMESFEYLDYHEMLERHDKLLKEIEIGCFLRNKLLLQRINNLLETINHFVSLLHGKNCSDYATKFQDYKLVNFKD